MVDYLASLKPMQSDGTLTEHTVHGVTRKAKKSRGGGASRSSSPCPYA